MRIVLPRTGEVIADRLATAASARQRMGGLIGTPELVAGHGLLLEPCNQVHTFGLRYPIDVVFLDRQMTVSRVVRALRPRRVTAWIRRARTAVELPAGAAASLEVGDRLELVD